MLGTDRYFEKIQDALKTISERSAIFAVHGGAGVGKTRFLREVGFEAALNGADYQCFPDLHREPSEGLARLLSQLRALPSKGTLTVLEWNDDQVLPAMDRFFRKILSSDEIREIHLENLNHDDALSLLQGPLDPKSAAELLEAVYTPTQGNPQLLLETVNALRSQKKIRRRVLLPAWKDFLHAFGRSPESLLEGRLNDAHRLASEFWQGGKRKEALETIDYAAEKIADPAEVSRLLRMKTNILGEMGKYEEANACCDRWFALKAADEPMPLKTVKYWLITGINLQNLGRHVEASERLHRCLEEGATHRNEVSIRSYLVRAESLLGLEDLKQGRPEEALARFEKALSLAGEDAARRAEIGRNLAASLSRLGRWDEAKRRLEEAKKFAQKASSVEGEFSIFLQEGNLALENGDLKMAEASYARTEAIARYAKSDLWLAIARNNRGYFERRRGELKTALNLLRQAHEVFEFLGNPNDLASNLRELALAEASVGRFGTARGFLARFIPEISEKWFLDEK